MGSVEDSPGGEIGASTQEAFEPLGVQFDVTVENGDPGSIGLSPAPVYSAGEAGIRAEANHLAAIRFGKFGGAVSRSVIDDDNMVEWSGLGAERAEEPIK